MGSQGGLALSYWILLTTAIGEDSTLTIGIVLTLFGILVSGIWWAATMQSKLNSILDMMTLKNMRLQQGEERMDRSEDRINKLDKRLMELEWRSRTHSGGHVVPRDVIEPE